MVRNCNSSITITDTRNKDLDFMVEYFWLPEENFLCFVCIFTVKTIYNFSHWLPCDVPIFVKEGGVVSIQVKIPFKTELIHVVTRQ